MSKTLAQLLHQSPVVSFIQADDPAIATATAKTLVSGGLTVIEVVPRTDKAITCLEHLVKSPPQAIVQKHLSGWGN